MKRIRQLVAEARTWLDDTESHLAAVHPENLRDESLSFEDYDEAKADFYETAVTRFDELLTTLATEVGDDDSLLGHTEARDVYGVSTRFFGLWLKTDLDGSLLIDDAPFVDTGRFNVVIENREGTPTLLFWKEDDFGQDPSLRLNLVTGEFYGNYFL